MSRHRCVSLYTTHYSADFRVPYERSRAPRCTCRWVGLRQRRLSASFMRVSKAKSIGFMVLHLAARMGKDPSKMMKVDFSTAILRPFAHELGGQHLLSPDGEQTPALGREEGKVFWSHEPTGRPFWARPSWTRSKGGQSPCTAASSLCCDLRRANPSRCGMRSVLWRPPGKRRRGAHRAGPAGGGCRGSGVGMQALRIVCASRPRAETGTSGRGEARDRHSYTNTHSKHTRAHAHTPHNLVSSSVLCNTSEFSHSLCNTWNILEVDAGNVQPLTFVPLWRNPELWYRQRSWWLFCVRWFSKECLRNLDEDWMANHKQMKVLPTVFRC